MRDKILNLTSVWHRGRWVTILLFMCMSSANAFEITKGEKYPVCKAVFNSLERVGFRAERVEK